MYTFSSVTDSATACSTFMFFFYTIHNAEDVHESKANMFHFWWSNKDMETPLGSGTGNPTP